MSSCCCEAGLKGLSREHVMQQVGTVRRIYDCFSNLWRTTEGAVYLEESPQSRHLIATAVRNCSSKACSRHRPSKSCSCSGDSWRGCHERRICRITKPWSTGGQQDLLMKRQQYILATEPGAMFSRRHGQQKSHQSHAWRGSLALLKDNSFTGVGCRDPRIKPIEP
jgi:hypothetical protein